VTLTRNAPMRRSTFKAKAPVREPRPDRSAEFASYSAPRPAAVMAANLDQEAPVVLEKEDHFYSEAWRRAVAELPCVLCDRWNETQAAHRNEDKAGGKKLMDDCWTAALCVRCHSAIDQGKDFTREERRQRLDLAILLTIRALARAGKLRIAA